MQLNRRNFIGAIGASSVLPLVGCGSASEVTIALDILVTGADAALTALQANGGISAAEATILEGYLSEVSTFVDFVEKEFASTDTVVQKAAKISQEAVTLGIKQLPPGVPQIVASVFNAVLQDVANVLSATQTTTTALLMRGINSFQSQKKAWNGKMNSADQKKLAQVHAKNQQLRAKLDALPKK